jgi:hypothetical protein
MIYNTKMQILYRIWNRELLHISKGALKGKDKKSKQMLSDLNTIRDDVKDALLRAYLFRCTVKHSLAFFQWRARFSHHSSVSHPLPTNKLTSLYRERNSSSSSNLKPFSSSVAPTYKTPPTLTSWTHSRSRCHRPS